MRPVTSSIDGAESGSEDGIARPAPLPSTQMVAGASYLACTLAAQVKPPSQLLVWQAMSHWICETWGQIDASKLVHAA